MIGALEDMKEVKRQIDNNRKELAKEFDELRQMAPEYYEDYEELYGETEFLHSKLLEIYQSKTTKNWIRDQEIYAKNIKKSKDPMRWLDKVIESESLDAALKEYGMSEEYITENLKSDPSLLASIVWDKARDAVDYDIGHIFNLLNPSKNELQRLGKTIANEIEELNKNGINVAFQNVRQLGDDMPEEVTTLLDLEDKIVRMNNFVMDIASKEKYCVYLWAVILRGYAKTLNEVRMERHVEEDKVVELKEKSIPDLEAKKNILLQDIASLEAQKGNIQNELKTASVLVNKKTAELQKINIDSANNTGGNQISEKIGERGGNSEGGGDSEDLGDESGPDDIITIEGSTYRLLEIKDKKLYVKDAPLKNGAHVAKKLDRSASGGVSDKDYKEALKKWKGIHDEEE
ncbi:MAG: hypothetical protein KGH62_01515 [Candidatus Micrarchaeota archaeon]|nr:hypothetical protein [Candidatus Micrarchaeota archaeon]